MKEMALIKLGVGQEDRTAVLQIAQHYGAKTVDLTEESIVLLCTGNSDKLDRMIEMLGRYPLVELVRTGKVVMARGAEAT